MPLKSERTCLVFLGMGIWVNAGTLSAIGLTPEDEIVCPKKSALVTPTLALEGESLSLCFRSRSKTERMLDVGDVSRGVGVENYDVVEVGRYAVRVFDDLVDGLEKPATQGAASLRHDEPLEESGGRAESSQGYGVLVDGDLVERRHEVEQGEDAAFSYAVEDLVDAGDGQLAQGADGVKLFVVGGYSNVGVFLGNGDHRAGVWRSGVLDQADSQILVEHIVGLHGEKRVDAVRAGKDGGAIRGDGNLEQNKGARTEVGFGRGETVGELAKNFRQHCDDRRGPTRNRGGRRRRHEDAAEVGPRGGGSLFVGRPSGVPGVCGKGPWGDQQEVYRRRVRGCCLAGRGRR